MKIKFRTDFRGRETGEQFYQAGQVVELEAELAERLVRDGRAEIVTGGSVEQPAEVKDATPQSTPKNNHRRRR